MLSEGKTGTVSKPARLSGFCLTSEGNCYTYSLTMNGYSQPPKEERIKSLRTLIPEAFDEGNIDFEKLRATLGENVNISNERYVLNWVGKRDAFRVMQLPSSETLAPCREESVDFDNTQNLFIEGENMEVLKILQRSYFGKVKMIYIDPPYNTGSDSFVYPDKFSESKEEYLRRVGDKDEDGYMICESWFHKNSKENGQYHSNWLSMMMPRLYLAKSLLREDGVIFISIDDNEQAQLRLLCDEVFGEDSFVATIHCQMSTTQGLKVGAAQDGNIVKNAEYVLCYTKDGHKDVASEQRLYDLRPDYDEHYSLFLKDDGTIVKLSDVHNYKFPRDCSNKKPMGIEEAFRKSEEFREFVNSHLENIVRSDKVKGVGGVETTAGLKERCWKAVELKGKTYLLTLDSKGKTQQLLRLKNSWGKTDGFYKEEGLRKIRGDWWEGFYTDMGNVSKEGDIEFSNGKKPVRLILQLAKMCTKKNDIILDFFSGSATTAHAVMQLNYEDGGHRRFIMVQLPEKCDEESDAFKAGFKNICEIGKERIRRAGAQIRETIEAGQKKQKNPIAVPDLGFKVFKQQESNFKEWRETKGSDKEVWKQQLIDFQDPVAPNAVTDNMLYELLLKNGKDLNSTIEHKDGYYAINGKELVLMLDGSLNQTVVDAIIALHPEKAIALDRLFNGNNPFKTNTAQQVRGAGIEFRTI